MHTAEPYESVTNFLLDKIKEDTPPKSQQPTQQSNNKPPAVTVMPKKIAKVEKKPEKEETTGFRVAELRYVITEEQVELEELRCGICFRFCNEAVQTEGCGHLFCETCLAEYFVKNNACPNCGIATREY